ncbi:hypothetical protein DYBT9275_05632 [Dyadobacter sp. CECT 9275]|uniref:Patatin-like phospholipase n=1 Tax=Dyadobacter helix TaxID=2822344 RepID=A0A916JIS2_9BACT|nr:patatin-like phospholipase family protein [Dyadobacter sp. CECT 9275]CAG5016771.1 hypothetical protein DYBT9275_05632 [Dyadobacter sp. CECT 9275]
MITPNPSLRLVEILKDEFKNLYGSPEAVKMVLADKGRISCRNSRELLKRIEWCLEAKEHKGLNLRASPADGKYTFALSQFDQLRFSKLSAWSEEKAESAETDDSMSIALSITEISVENALTAKIGEKDLLLKEEWMMDAPLRAYTRGLLDLYINDRSWWKKLTSRSEKATFSDQDIFTLNRLVIEDVYSEFVLRKDDQELEELRMNMHHKYQKALCLSGGGIRSGTFALGVIQGLASLGIKPDDFTFLSTVSGGGYTGGWLTSWLHHEGADKVHQQLKPQNVLPREPGPIRHLRQYSNYMSPLVGLFSADTWTLLAIYIRNLIVNWLIIIPFLTAFVALPWFFSSLLHLTVPHVYPIAGILIGGILFIYSDLYTKKHPPLPKPSSDSNPMLSVEDTKSTDKSSQTKFLAFCLLPGAAGVLIWAISWYWFINADFSSASQSLRDFHDIFIMESHKDERKWWVVAVAVVFVLIELAIFYIVEKRQRYIPHFLKNPDTRLGRFFLQIGKRIDDIPPRFKTGKAKDKRGHELVFLAIAGVLSGILLTFISDLLPDNTHTPEKTIVYTCLAFPLFMLTLLFNSFVYEGLKSTIAEDSDREWTARYSAWFLIAALGWLVISGIVLYGPVLVEKLLGMGYVLTFGAAISYLTAYLGQRSSSNGKSGKDAEKNTGLLSYLSLPLLALLALVALLVALSYLVMTFLGILIEGNDFSWRNFSPLKAAAQNPIYAVLVFAGMLVLTFISSKLIDSNRFSLHAMYRSRLIRAYLGAARPEGVRRPDPFTGFDESDNIDMGKLARKDASGQLKKPFHIINLAMNLVAGKNLAWQERKASSFTVSSLHAGSLGLGYRRVYLESQPGAKKLQYGGDDGISLGTALTISGAAVSPNMGYSTSPLVAFFMTLFNLRLGWWLGNPGPVGDQSFFRSSPKLAIVPIMSEMFAQTNDLNQYVNLSDGGHFENLGLYEMILRRNRFILLSDGSCDASCQLEDLGNAIRKIRIDFGTIIDFPLGFDMFSRLDADKTNGKYWAIGRIRYPENQNETDSNSPVFHKTDGILLYVKPGFYGTEPKDIFNYASVNPAFPHETTADQFFSESQFESYRALGIHATEQINEQLTKTFDLSINSFIQAKGDDWETKIISPLNTGIKKRTEFARPKYQPTPAPKR